MVAVSVKDEFAPLRVAIVHDDRNAIDFSMDDFRWSADGPRPRTPRSGGSDRHHSPPLRAGGG